MPKTDLPERLKADRCALVVVDIQEKFRDIIHGMDGVLAGATRLIQFCQRLDIPILVTEHYPRGLGVTVPEIRNEFKSFRPIEKIDFSCAGSAEFNQALAKLKADQIILCGIETHVCIYQTAFDLLRQGKQVSVAVDAVSSCGAADRSVGLQRMSELGAQSMGVQMIMFEILEKAGTEQFKLVANILKN